MSTIGPFENVEIASRGCTRTKPHDGPCNGWATTRCNPAYNERDPTMLPCPVCKSYTCQENEHLFAPRERDPNGLDAKAPGAKLDAGKSPVRRGLLEYFPRSCLAIANLSARGAKKYSWNGWEKVENGIDRYGDCQIRHILKAAMEGPVDKDWDESEETLHATAEAWNAIARLELILRAREATK